MVVRRLADASVQPEGFTFTPENLAWARGQIAKYPEGRQQSAIIPLLWRAQEQAGGWVPEAALRHVGELLGMPPIRVLEVATFYSMFNLAPVGRYHVQLCGTTPCMIRGAGELRRVCEARIGHEHDVTPDGTFSWVEVECLGACVNAPMAQINYDYYEDLDPESFNRILDRFAAGEPVEPGPQIDRQFSAPFGGLTTLTEGAAARPAEHCDVPGATTPTNTGAALTDDDPKKHSAASNERTRDHAHGPVQDKSLEQITGTRRD